MRRWGDGGAAADDVPDDLVAVAASSGLVLFPFEDDDNTADADRSDPFSFKSPAKALPSNRFFSEEDVELFC